MTSTLISVLLRVRNFLQEIFKNGLSIPNGSLFVLRTILGDREDLGIWPHRSC